MFLFLMLNLSKVYLVFQELLAWGYLKLHPTHSVAIDFIECLWMYMAFLASLQLVSLYNASTQENLCTFSGLAA